MNKNMNKGRLTALSLALGSALLLGACGGGGGGGSSTPSSSLAMSVTPTLGYFFSGTVTVTDASGNTVGSGTVSNGAVQIQVPASYNGATLIVKVTGGSYWDEALRQQATQTQPLYALIPSFSSASNTVAVNPLTNAAAAMLLQGNSTLPANTSASTVAQANSTMAALVGLAGIDLVSTVPTRIASATDKVTGTTPPDLVEAKLAALAFLAQQHSTSADGEAGNLAQLVASSVTSPSAIVSSATLGNAAASLNTVTSAAAAAITDDPTVEQGLDSSAYQAVSGTLPPAMQTAISNGSGTLPGEVASAKTFFTALRSGMLNYANPMTHTGVLNVQASKLATELAPLGQGMSGVHELVEMIKVMQAFSSDSSTSIPCAPGTQTGQTVCTLPRTNGETLTLTLTPTNTVGMTAVNWALSTGPTGVLTMLRVNNGTALKFTADGQLDPSTPAGSYTQVGAGNAASNNCQNPLSELVAVVPRLISPTTTWTAQLQGDIADMVADSASGLHSCTGYSPDLALHFSGSGSNAMGQLTVNSSDATQDTLDLAATVQTPGFTVQGTVQVPALLTSGSGSAPVTTGNPVVIDGSVSTAGLQYVNASNALAAENGSTAPGFTLLSGELKATATLGQGVTAYDPASPASASNNLSVGVTFTGQVFASATDPGLKLQLGVGHSWSATAGNYLDTLSLGYYDLTDNLSLTANASATEPNAQVTQVQLSAGNGVTATWQLGQTSTNVYDGTDAVGTLNGGRVSYADGSYQSIF